jgi:hypothetical protein
MKKNYILSDKLVLGAGTTFSGFAWLPYHAELAAQSLETVDLCDVRSVFQYPGCELVPFHYPKTATQLFYRNEGDTDPLWGWHARNEAVSNRSAFRSSTLSKVVLPPRWSTLQGGLPYKVVHSPRR